MSAAPLTRARDRLEPRPESAPEIELEPLLGVWTVFTPTPGMTAGLTELEIEPRGEGRVSVRVTGSGDFMEEMPVWGVREAQVFTDDVAGREAWAFRARFELAFQDVELFGYLNRGVLAVDAGTVFTDDSGRSPYFTRELFYRP